MLLSFIQSLTRAQKRAVMIFIDMAIVPLALLFSVSVQVLPVTMGEIAGHFVTILPYLLVAVLGLTIWLEMPKVRLKNFEGRAVLRYALFSAATTLAFVPLGYIGGLPVPLATYILFGLNLFAMGTVARFAMRAILIELYSRVHKTCRVIIYGAGTTGTELVSALRTHGAITPVAFIDDNSSLQDMIISGLPVYAPSRLATIVDERAVDRVLLAIPSLSAPKQAQIARKLQAMGLEVQVLPSFSQLIGHEPLIEKFVELPSRSLLGRSEVGSKLGEAAQSYRGKSIFISGAGGTIGSELSRQVLACRPKRLVMFEMSEFALYSIDQELRTLAEGAGIELVPVLGTVTDADHVRRTLADYEIDIVLHAAAYKHVPLVEQNPLVGIINNVFGTHVLGRESFEAGVDRFILVSSDKAVRPTSMMGATKRLCELILQDLASRVPEGQGPRFSMVRFGNVLGSSGSVLPLFQDQITRGGPVTVTHRNVTRYFMTVQEAGQLVLQAGAMAEGGEVYVLDMGKPVPILRLARQSIEAAGYSVCDADNPEGDIEIKFIGLRPGEKLHEELTLAANPQPTKHPKITKVRENSLSELEMARVLRQLRETVQAGDMDAAYNIVATAVESFEPAERAAESL